MQKYNPDALYSFRYDRKILPEIQMKAVGEKHKKERVEMFYAERTTDPTKIIVPVGVCISPTMESARPCGGLVGNIKEKDYFMGKMQVELSDAKQVHCGAGIVTVKVINNERNRKVLGEW